MARILATSASLILTENCNLACTYCFEKHHNKYMDEATVVRTLDWLSNNALETGEGEFSIILFGGEPLLNFKCVKKAILYGEKMAQIKNLRFTVSLITNATVMTDEIRDFLKEHRDAVDLRIQLSVDGTPEVQNEYRITKAGKGSFDMVAKNIPVFKEIYDNNPDDKRLSIHGCVNKKTLPKLSESFIFFHDILNFKQIWFLAISEENWDKEDAKIYDQECAKIFAICKKDVEASGDIEDTFNYAPFDRYHSLGCGRNLPCSAGRNFVSIATDGGIYPCHQIYFHDEYNDTLLGNVMEPEVPVDTCKQRIFLKYEESDLGCGDCKNDACYRCLAANWVHNGAMFSQIKGNYCLMSSVENKYQKIMAKLAEKYQPEEDEECSCGGECSCENNKEHSCDDNHECECKGECHKNKDSITCLCNLREGISNNGCDIVKNQDYCQSGNNPENIDCLCDMRTY